MSDGCRDPTDCSLQGRDYWVDTAEPTSADRRSRAQSTTLGFVFVFSLITLTIGGVYAVGFSGLQDAQSSEQATNMERAFSVLDDNLEDITKNDAPSRATEIKLNGGQLSVTDSTTIRINVTNTSDPADNDTYTATVRPIVYTTDDTKIVYAHGAVMRSDGDSSVMLSEPDWLVDEDQAVVPFILTTQAGNQSNIGGQGTVLVIANNRAKGLGGNFTTGPSATAEVDVTVESPRADAWKRYFESRGFTAVDGNPADDDGDGVQEVTYRFETDSLYVPRTNLGIELQR